MSSGFQGRLAQIRKQKNLTKSEMAQAVGMTVPGYWRLENETGAKTFEKLPRIAKALGCQIDDLFPEMDDVQKEAPQAQPDGDQLPGQMDMDEIDTWGD